MFVLCSDRRPVYSFQVGLGRGSEFGDSDEQKQRKTSRLKSSRKPEEMRNKARKCRLLNILSSFGQRQIRFLCLCLSKLMFQRKHVSANLKMNQNSCQNERKKEAFSQFLFLKISGSIFWSDRKTNCFKENKSSFICCSFPGESLSCGCPSSELTDR